MTNCYFYPQLDWMAEYRTAHGLTPETHQALLECGYFRQGPNYYVPVCAQCQECIPIRTLVADFRPSPSQRRIWRRNQDLRVEIARPSYSEERFQLYQRYQQDRWFMTVEDPEHFRQSVVVSFGEVWEFTYWLGSQLLGLGVVDETPDAGNSRYFVYECDKARGLGIFSLLCELEWCRELKKRHLYLGMYVPSASSMDYKASLRPFELRLPGRGWKAYADRRAVQDDLALVPGWRSKLPGWRRSGEPRPLG